MTGFVVESSVGTGTARVYVATEDRAREIVRDGLQATPSVTRTYRRIDVAEMPLAARENIERAAREG